MKIDGLNWRLNSNLIGFVGRVLDFCCGCVCVFGRVVSLVQPCVLNCESCVVDVGFDGGCERVLGFGDLVWKWLWP